MQRQTSLVLFAIACFATHTLAQSPTCQQGGQNVEPEDCREAAIALVLDHGHCNDEVIIPPGGATTKVGSCCAAFSLSNNSPVSLSATSVLADFYAGIKQCTRGQTDIGNGITLIYNGETCAKPLGGTVVAVTNIAAETNAPGR